MTMATYLVTGPNGLLVVSNGPFIQGAAVATTPFVLDQNSIVPGGLDGYEWRMAYPGQAPTVRKLAASDASGERTLVEVNQEQHAPPGGMLARPFTLPPTCSGVTVTLPLMIAGNANPVTIRVTDQLGQTVLGSTVATPTGGLLTASLSVSGLTALTEYQVQILVNVSGQADFYAGRVTVTPTGGTGLWAAPFQRIDVSRGSILDTNETGWAMVRYPAQSALSHVDFVTNATSIIVETFDNLGGAIPPPYDAMVYTINGYVGGALNPAIDRVDYNTLDLTLGGLLTGAPTNRIGVVCGPQAANVQSTNETANGPLGTFTCGIYVPTSASLGAPLPSPSVRDTWVFYGDSKLTYYATPAADGPFGPLRSQNIRAICEAFGGRTLFQDVGANASSATVATGVAACLPFVIKLCANRPSTIVIAIGRNDFFTASYTLAQWTQALKNLISTIHIVAPNAQVKLATFTREVSEPNNSNGDTMDSWRLAMTTAAQDTVTQNNPTFVSVLPWDQQWTVANAANYTYAGDGIHVNDRGYSMMSAVTLGTQQSASAQLGSPQGGEPYPWNPLFLGANLVGWWDSTQMQTSVSAGAGMSAVTAVGGGPTVTLSGTPLFPFNLLIAFSATNTFKWSIDGGLSWVQRGVAVASSVVLPGTGITANFAAGTYTTAYSYAAGTQASQLTDLSGTGNHMVQATGANQMFVQNVPLARINAAPGLKGNGTSTFYKRAGISLPLAFSAFIVAKCVNQASDNAFFGSDSHGVMLDTNSATTVRMYSNPTALSATVTASQLHIYSCIFAASGLFRVDGVTQATGVMNNYNPTDFYLGQAGTASAFNDGNVLECIVLNVAASTVQMNQIEAYLGQKYLTGLAPL